VCAALTAVVALALCLPAPAGASAHRTQPANPSFSAHGSAEQVYVTGLASRARASLIDAAGKTVSTRGADSLGGLLFRNVRPGTGYRVRLTSNGAESGPITLGPRYLQAGHQG
jgi:hypothetical protein